MSAAALVLTLAAAITEGDPPPERCLILQRQGDDTPTSLPAACTARYTPCSTFKLANTLIGLETGVISGPDHRWAWDGVERRVPVWNRGHDLRSAMASSVVPYYQAVAREVGRERMQQWVERFDYGNADVSGPIDRFWLGDSLRISPVEQLGFVERLLEDELGISARSREILSDITVQSFGPDHVEHGKTGWCHLTGEDGPMVNWYLGWVERADEVHLFVALISGDEIGWNSARITARAALAEAGLLGDEGT